MSLTNNRLLKEWRDEWFCYWDGSFGVPSNPEEYVFSPHLKETPDGLARVQCNSNFSEENEQILLELHEKMKLHDVLCSSFGSESDYSFYPIIIKWENNVLLTPERVLEMLGAHNKLKSAITVISQSILSERSEGGLFQSSPLSDTQLNLDTEVFAALTTFETKMDSESENKPVPLIFYCGSELLNPVPFFVLGKMSSSVVGGFYSALVHT